MDESKPRMPIRRFDVFADFHRIKNEERGMPEDLAKGRAVWAAKVVAGRRYGGAPALGSARSEAKTPAQVVEEGYRTLGGVEQTGKTFDREIVNRMGPEFYQRVFHPAIERAVHEGKRYEDIRDEIRKGWK